jgi:hypothetical protein
MVAANADIRSDLHRMAESIAVRSDPTTLRDEPIDGPVGTFRDALLARYHEGYIEGLHDMAEAVVGYLNSRPLPSERRFGEPPYPA